MKKVLILGSSGLLGSALVQESKKNDNLKIFAPKRDTLDLENELRVKEYFAEIQPDYVVLAAAKVGGIKANMTYPVDFLTRNLRVSLNVIQSSLENNVERLINFGSNCMFPIDCEQPIRESSLLRGEIEKTNEPYALSKIIGIKLCQAYNKQYKMNFKTLIPASLFGPGDHFDENAHVIPMLIKKFHAAKLNSVKSVEVWGTGKPLREFLYVRDCAEAVFFYLLKNDFDSLPEIMNICPQKEISILDLAEMIKRIVGFKGEIVLNPKYPDGAMRKIMNNSLMKLTGWSPKYDFEEALKETYNYYISL